MGKWLVEIWKSHCNSPHIVKRFVQCASILVSFLWRDSFDVLLLSMNVNFYFLLLYRHFPPLWYLLLNRHWQLLWHISIFDLKFVFRIFTATLRDVSFERLICLSWDLFSRNGRNIYIYRLGLWQLFKISTISFPLRLFILTRYLFASLYCNFDLLSW